MARITGSFEVVASLVSLSNEEEIRSPGSTLDLSPKSNKQTKVLLIIIKSITTKSQMALMMVRQKWNDDYIQDNNPDAEIYTS